MSIPHDFKFPKRSFGKKNHEQRSFNAQWFKIHPWIHYDESQDLAFCYVCQEATKEGKVSTHKANKSFITAGFCNWKDATTKFKKHQQSDCHKETVERHIKLPQNTKDVSETLSAAHSEEKANNRMQLLTVLRSIRFLALQGLPLRGHDDSLRNFIQLLKLHGQSDESILKWMERKTDKFTSADIQNEILQVILRQNANSIRHNGYFTIMADETTAQSNREQVVIVLRHVENELTVQEEFIGLYVVPSIDAQTLTNVILDTLIRMNLSPSICRGQCYDGASNMSGCKKRVAVNISSRESRVLYIHCYGHALNLAVGDSVKSCKVMRDSLDTVYEMSKLIKYSPRRGTKLEDFKTEMNPDTPGFRVLCPTRWAVRAASLRSVLDNYSVLQSLWDICYAFVKDPETRARLVAVIKSQMSSFNFLFGVSLGYEVLRHTDNLSRALQHKDMSESEGQTLAELTMTTLASIRQDESYDKFWIDVTGKLEHLDPSLPRRRKTPARFETGDAVCEYPASVKDLYRPKYYEAQDLTINCAIDRFIQPGYKSTVTWRTCC